ncbi:DUF1330 domain-containing protein [Sphingomonas cavernae]|uniref:DUF1330 domain-containing protein n=1 Tax=Sphingomonas cavernae TaxID=2320861 RepID=A0A418WL75_9SPHN|nr:DUF1330 domain-containing protein [Sphingomonas cavernae]RJF90599.1 DUF1330 domain-containing protein [Sphingomonas cavernae]
MKAYLIITARILDRSAFLEGYAPSAARLVENFGGKYLLRAPGAERLEGSGSDGISVVISEWPSKAAALAFWNSPEYHEAKRLREGIAECEVLLIEAPSLAD